MGKSPGWHVRDEAGSIEVRIETYPAALAGWDLGVSDSISWDALLFDELLDNVTVASISLQSHRQLSCRHDSHQGITYRVFAAFSLTNGLAIAGILSDMMTDMGIIWYVFSKVKNSSYGVYVASSQLVHLYPVSPQRQPFPAPPPRPQWTSHLVRSDSRGSLAALPTKPLCVLA